MAKVASSDSKSKTKSHKSLTPEGRERQMISLAVDLAEKKLRDGTASSQVICHYLKLGTEREVLEREKIKKENELLETKKVTLEVGQRSEELVEEAIKAFKTYSGNNTEENDEEL